MENKKVRDSFKSKWGFILAGVGSAVGMGNLWRFPNLVSTYGGLTFIIPYLIFVVIIGSIGISCEIATGRSNKSGPFNALGNIYASRKLKGVGLFFGSVPIIGSSLLAIGYLVVMAWVFKYSFLSISGKLVKLGTDAISESSPIIAEFNSTASGFGANFWVIFGAIISLAILIFGVKNGIEKVNKIMMPLLFGLLLFLAVYMIFMPGSLAGYSYIFTIKDPSMLLNPKTWIYAFGQAFFSLSIAGNATVIYGSYLSDKEDVMSSARNIAIFDTIAALLAALVIVPAMASCGEKLSNGGPGLMFIYLVSVFNKLPGGLLISIVFYIAVAFAAISSIVSMFEATIEWVEKNFKLNRVLASIIVVVISATIAVFIQNITSDWMDFVSIYVCPIGALVVGIAFFYVLDRKACLNAINTGAIKPVSNLYIYFGRYLYCTIALLALILGAMLGGIG